MTDYDRARRAIENLGEDLFDLGFNVPRQIIDGENAVGRAVRECRNKACENIVVAYLKDLAAQVKALPESQKKKQAMQALNEAWEEWKDAIVDEAPDPRVIGQGQIARMLR